jgi:ESCRT-II complex subunit VPS22
MAGIQHVLDVDGERQVAARRIDQKRIAEAKAQLSQFKTLLQNFAKKHKDKILKDPEFRNSFNEMCEALNVDPLQSTRGLWAKFLPVGDFYHELAVKIIDICDPLKRIHGPLIQIDLVLAAVITTYGSPPKLCRRDIDRALKALKKIGYGYSVVKLGGEVFVKTVSFECDGDGLALMNLAEGTGFFMFDAALPMGKQRFDVAAASLMNEGLVWVDRGDRDGVTRYWVVALFTKGFQ